jgi:hypothetical protein
MVTPVSDGTAPAPRKVGRAGRRPQLYFNTAVAFAIIAVLGFTPTYWIPIATGTLTLHPATHVHGVLFFTWVVFVAVQAMLVSCGQTSWHRDAGLLGIALAALMVFSGMLATIVHLRAGLEGPRPEIARAAAALSVSGMLLFTAFVTAAVATIRRPAWHKRLIVLASMEVLGAAVGRLVRLMPGVAPSEGFVIMTMLLDAGLVAIVLADRRSTGRVHSAWILGGGVLLAMHVARLALPQTTPWVAFTRWLAALGA